MYKQQAEQNQAAPDAAATEEAPAGEEGEKKTDKKDVEEGEVVE